MGLSAFSAAPVILTVGIGAACAQAPDSLWYMSYDGLLAAYDLLYSEGGCAFCGVTENAPFGYDSYIARVDAYGNLLWCTTSNLNGTDHGYGLVDAGDGGFLAAGSIYLDPPNNTDVVQLRVSGDGARQWACSCGGLFTQYANAGVRRYPSGFVLAGIASNGSAPDFDFGLFVTSSTGALESQYHWDFSGYSDGAYSICQTQDGGYALAGYRGTGLSYWNARCHMTRLNSGYAIIWSKTFDYGHLMCIQEIPGGGFVMCGDAGSATSGMLIRTDAGGNVMWQNTYPEIDGHFADLLQTPDGGFVVAGESSGDIYLMKVDSLGGTEWTAAYGKAEPEGVGAIIWMDDGGMMICGDGSDAFLLRLGPMVSVADGSEIVPSIDFRIEGVSPNPMRAGCTIMCDAGGRAPLLTAYDTAGRKVMCWACQPVGGTQAIAWDGTSSGGEVLPDGVYILSLTSGDLSSSMEIVILR